jgi:hypothetical protein
MKRHEYRDRIIKTLNFEQQIYKEFEQLCQEENVYPSQKLQELMLETLQKKVVGQNPLNVLYGIEAKKPSSVEQSDIRLWLPRNDAIKMAKHVRMDERQWLHLSETCRIIARKVQTGYL